MMKISDVFIKEYCHEGVAEKDFKYNKGLLFRFFNDITGKIATNHEIWKLYGRMMETLNPEETGEILDIKLKECRSLMTGIWDKEIDSCEKLEKSIASLIKLVGKKNPSQELKWFVSNQVKVIEDCLQRTTTLEIPESFVIKD